MAKEVVSMENQLQVKTCWQLGKDNSSGKDQIERGGKK